MTRIALLLAGCAALGLSACDHPDAARQRAERSLKAVSKLDCPQTQGALTRISAAADGLSCVYGGGDNAEVTLAVVRLENGDARKALAPIEAELRTLMPGLVTDKDKVAATAEGDAGDEEVDIRLPGVTIEAGDGGARVKVAGASIDATDEGAEVRVTRNVEVEEAETAGAKRKHRRRDDEVYARFLLASDKATGGYDVVGYDARGPKGGPLVVATVKVKEGGDRDEDFFEDVEDLIRHNVGGRRRGGHLVID
ncbi:MAG: hypothetical protein ACOY4K_11375 [Pseudomonadota bacterium]